MMNIKTQVKILTLVLTFLNINTVFSQTLFMPHDGATCVSTEPIFMFSGETDINTIEILNCSSIGLADYTHQSTFNLDINIVNDDLSGITYNSITETLFAVTNGGKPGSVFEAVYEVDLNGTLLNTFNLVDADDSVNAATYFDDTEGIVHLYDRTFALVEEKKGTILIIDLPLTSSNIYYTDADIIQLPGEWNNQVNNGLEGISYDPVADQFYVVKESFPKKYYVVDMPVVFPFNAPENVAYDLPINTSEAAGTHYIGLTSGFADTPVADNRLIVDEAGKKVVEVDANYQIISEMTLPDYKYEGITMDDDGTIYMTQERNKIHVYTRPAWPEVIHSATVSEEGYFMPPNVLEEGTEYCWRVHNGGDTSVTYSFETIGAMTICASISSSGNDVEELENGSMYMTSSDIELIYDPLNNRNAQKIGLRYEDLGIPQGAIIMSAYLQFTTDEASTGTVNLTIRGEDADDASAFTTANGNLSGRPTTQASVMWSPPNWTIEHERNNNQKTPDLAAILQEIVDRDDFDQNSAVAFIISGSSIDKRIAESFDGSPELAPELCVTFVPERCGLTCVDVNISLWLEGAYDPTGDTMRTGLYEQNALPAENTGTNPTPAGQPYYVEPWEYAGTEGLGWEMDDYAPTVVDWVLVSFRKDETANSEVFRTAALLHKDGNVEFLEECILPDSLMWEPLYIVVDHRNHLVAMSDIAMPPAVTATMNGDEYGYFMYDFRQQDSYHSSTTVGQKQLPNGDWSLFGGDMNGDCDINGADKSIWYDQNGLSGEYLPGDIDMNADVNGADKSFWSESSGYSSGVPK